MSAVMRFQSVALRILQLGVRLSELALQKYSRHTDTVFPVNGLATHVTVSLHHESGLNEELFEPLLGKVKGPGSVLSYVETFGEFVSGRKSEHGLIVETVVPKQHQSSGLEHTSHVIQHLAHFLRVYRGEHEDERDDIHALDRNVLT